MSETNYISSIKAPDGKTYGIKDPDARIRMTEITWADLKQLRDNSQLIPGMQYRITDYNCTTTQENTTAAHNQFDIIVTADNTNKLNEVARAMQHKGYIYFSDCNLTAWKIWYCLDNDKNRFTWADKTNGKGVIYRMIDEFNNDVPYDFKNILFKDPTGTSIYCYTFARVLANGNSADSSINIVYKSDSSINIVYKCYSNTIKEYIPTITQFTYNRPRSLNYIIFFNSCYCNSFGTDCHNIIFGSNCHGNSFGSGCSDIILDDSCNNNSFGSNCKEIEFAPYKDSTNTYSAYDNNHFGDECTHIIFKKVGYGITRNYNFANGLNFNSNNYITIEGIGGKSYETKVEIDSNGVLKTFCLADLIVSKNDDAYPYSSTFIGEI